MDSLLVCTLITDMDVTPIPSYKDRCASCKSEIWVAESTRELGKLNKMCTGCFLESGLGSIGEATMSNEQRRELKEIMGYTDEELDKLLARYSDRIRQISGTSDN